MALNPNALPWSSPSAPTQNHNQHDAHFSHQQQHFYPHNQMPPMMVPHPQHGGRHGMMGHGHYPVQMQNQHSNQYHIRPRGMPFPMATLPPQTPATAPSYKKPNPVIILVFGYRKVGKTTVAKRLAEARNFNYISLKPKGNEPQTPESLLSGLAELLSRKSTLEGIVIDDAVVHNKFQPYYVQALLQKHGLRFDFAVVLDTELDSIKDRNVDYDDPLERQAHPESYEFCASYLQGEDTVVIGCRGKTVEEVVNDALRQVPEVISTKETFLKLKDVELMPKCPLEKNATVVAKVLKEQAQHLNLGDAAPFPFSEPNYLLDYALFARQAYALRSYMITPWIQGDKVSLIGYENDTFIHLPTYNIIFQFTSPPVALKQLAKDNAGPDGMSFILEATFAKDKIFISDLLMLGHLKGSNMLVNERVEMLKTKLSELTDPEGMVCLLPWYPAESMKACVLENSKASGVLFINPDGITAGGYDSRNFLYPLGLKKTVELRIWNGNFNSGLWTFDAYCEEAGNERIIENIPVHISDDDVNSYCINDGNILECAREDANSGPNKGKKGSVPKRYAFRRRCNWMLKPTTVFKQEVFVDDPKWPLERVEEVCASLKYCQAVRPEEPKETDG